MTALKIVELEGDRLLIETFDFRSEFSFEEFCEWVSETLQVSLAPKMSDDELESRTFKFEGDELRLSWEEQFGSYIEGLSAQRKTLEQVMKKLMQA